MIEKIKNTILQGDCVQKMQQIPDESIDVIFADPPYFMQTDGDLLRVGGDKFAGVNDEWDKFHSYQDYDKFCFDWLYQARRILKKDGTIWVIGSFQNIYRLGYIMQNLGFWILNDVIWHKSNPVPNFGGTRFCNAHETLLWCSKSAKSKFTFNYKTMKAFNGDKQDKSVWQLALCTGNERIKGADGKKAHSTQKPESLLYKIILSSTKPDDIVLDPFFGTGTTGAVAKRLGRNYIGIEQDGNYIAIANHRINTVTSNPNDIELLSLEVKPPKVPMKLLLQHGLLLHNEPLFNRDGLLICHVNDKGDVYDDTDVLSIHKMSAKYLNKVNHNGWDYFYIKRDNQLKALNQLRYDYHNQAIQK